MKTRNRLTALLTGTALLGGMLTAVPVTAAETPADSVRSCTLDALMAMDEAQINALPDFSYYAAASDYAEAVKETENFHEGELKLGKERFFVKLTDPRLADYLYLYVVAADDSSGEMRDYPVLSWAETENLLGIPAAYMEDVTEGESRGYLYVTVNLTAYGQENACKTYIMTEAKLRANENIADVYGTGLGGGKPVSDERTVVIPAETDTTAAQDGKTVFLERIAGWENAKLSDCVILESGLGLMLLTPTKPYSVSRHTFLPYLVYLNGGTLNADAVTAKWKEKLRQVYAEEYLKNDSVFDTLACTAEQSGDCWLVTPSADTRYADELLAVLKEMPEVQRIAVKCSYQTHDRVNSSGGYSFLFTVSGKGTLTAADFPELTGVKLAERGTMPQTTRAAWGITLESDRYADYFAAAKYLQTLGFVHDLTFGYVTTCLADTAEDAYYQSDDAEILFDRSTAAGSREDFFERIAGWQNAALSDCIVLGADELLTPDKPYQISRVRFTPYSVFLRSGGTLDPEAVKAKWKEMLLAAGYPENAGMWDYYTCEITETDGGYQIRVPQDAYAGISLADCLMTFPEVQRIEAQFGYATDDRPNQPSDFALRFTVDGTETPQPEDFPALSGMQIAGDTPLPAQQSKSTWTLTLESGQYADYYEAAKYLQTLSFVQDLKLVYSSTELGDASDDARILDPAPTVLYNRGDINQDGSADVGDAVLLARYLAADAEAVVYDQGLKNADVDGNGSVRDEDLTALLRRIAKKF